MGGELHITETGTELWLTLCIASLIVMWLGAVGFVVWWFIATNESEDPDSRGGVA